MTEKTERLSVVELNQTCDSCPSQWEGRTADGRHVYVRFRSGFLAIGVGDTLDDAVEMAMGDAPLIGAQLSEDRFDGYLDYTGLKTATGDRIAWP